MSEAQRQERDKKRREKRIERKLRRIAFFEAALNRERQLLNNLLANEVVEDLTQSRDTELISEKSALPLSHEAEMSK